MTIPNDMTRFVISGHLPGNELFNTSLWCFGSSPSNQAQATAHATDFGSRFAGDWMPTLQALIALDCGYDKVTSYHYPAGGPLAAFIGEYTITGGAGTGVGDEHSLQTAVVMTTLTGIPGRRHRGRMYLPVNSEPLANHQLTSTAIGAITAAAQNFINGVQGSAVTGDPVVLSQVGAGSTAPITALRVDSRLDVQRRRAESQDALFTSTVVV